MSHLMSSGSSEAGPIIVIGGSGFVGSAVMRRARAVGLAVIAVHAPRLTIDPGVTGRPPQRASYADEIERMASQLTAGATVVNAAGIAAAVSEESPQLFGANALLPWLLAHAAKDAGARRLVHVSSAAVKGSLPIDGSTMTAPFSPYSRSKDLGERWLTSVDGLEVTILRPTSVHGPGRPVTETLRRVARSPLASVAGSGRTRTPQVQVETVARSVIVLATHRGAVPRITLTPDEQIETGQFMQILGGHAPVRVPEPIARLVVGAASRAGRWSGAVAANARRLELMWFGQPQASSWLDDHPEARAPRDGWRALAPSAAEPPTDRRLEMPVASKVGDRDDDDDCETQVIGRVVVLNQFALPSRQGGFTRNEDLFSRIDDVDYRIIAGDRHHYTQETYTSSDPKFTLVGVPRSGASLRERLVPWLTYSAKAFFATLRERDVDAVFASSPHLITPVVGLVAARLKRAAFVLEVRDHWPDSLVSAGILTEESLVYRLLKQIEIRLVQSADVVVGVSPAWKEYFAVLGLEPERYWGVPNGSQAELFEIADDREVLRHELGISGFTAIYAGAHGTVNDIDGILDAAVALPDVNFLLVGDGTEKEAAIDRAAREGLSNVEFRDWVPKSELPRLLAACDVGLHSILPLEVLDRGMSPNKLFDYLAAGLPVVSNAAGPLAGVLARDECGALGETDDLDKCLATVRDADDSMRARWRERARELLSGRYSRTVAASMLSTAIAEAIERHDRRRPRRRNR